MPLAWARIFPVQPSSAPLTPTTPLRPSPSTATSTPSNMLPRRGADEGQTESRTSEAAGEGGMRGAVPRPPKAGRSLLPWVRSVWPDDAAASPAPAPAPQPEEEQPAPGTRSAGARRLRVKARSPTRASGKPRFTCCSNALKLVCGRATPMSTCRWACCSTSLQHVRGYPSLSIKHSLVVGDCSLRAHRRGRLDRPPHQR